jgi:hypothetical protein
MTFVEDGKFLQCSAMKSGWSGPKLQSCVLPLPSSDNGITSQNMASSHLPWEREIAYDICFEAEARLNNI